MVRAILGGSFGLLQGSIIAALLAFGAFHYADHKATKAANTRLQGEVFWAEFHRDFARHEATVLGVRLAEREAQGERQRVIERTIYEQPDTNHCATAGAVRAGLDGVRERRAARAAERADHERRAVPLLPGARRSD